MARKISYERIGEYVQTALNVLKENDGQLPSKQVKETVGKRLDLIDYELDRYEKSGKVRWESILHFYSINASKAGWLRKKKGIWYLTPEGEEALKLSPLDFYKQSTEAFKKWKIEKGEAETEDVESSEFEKVIDSPSTTFSDAEELARSEIKEHIQALDPYDFQDLVAALMRGMDYHTPFVAPKGKDGGVDIIAYQDPLGTKEPRIKVQVKHKSQKTTPAEIRALSGVLKTGEIGIFVSTGGFTPDSLNALRSSNQHMEKIDLDAFIDLWGEYYEKMNEEDRSLMPLRPILFLAPDE